MKEFKIIATTNKEEFEKKIKEYLEQNYEVKNSNLSITYDESNRITKFDKGKITTAFYAYMEK